VRMRSAVPWVLLAGMVVMLLGYWVIGVILCLIAITIWVVES